MDSLIIYLLGGIVRLVQGFVAASPTLLVGLLIASIMRFYLAESGIKRLFGGETWKSLPQSWLVGMLLPVCSIGVLPILREMRRAGVKPGAMSAFALSAPLFNPLSLLYGLTLSRPLVIMMFAAGSLVIVTVLGVLWDSISKQSTISESSQANSENRAIGLRRLGLAFVYICRELTGPVMGWMLLALAGLVVLSTVLPFGSMQQSVERDDWLAPLTMTSVAIPVYATPMLAMSQLGMMFQHANSPGAAFALLILGTGLNLAIPVWFAKQFGVKASFIWLLVLVLIVLGVAYAVNKPLIPQGVEPAGHTHAFDIYANPFVSKSAPNWESVTEAIKSNVDLASLVAAGLLGVLMVAGGIFASFNLSESTIVAKQPSRPAGAKSVHQQQRFDVIVSPKIVGMTMLLGLVAVSGVACYAYYPHPNECLKEISAARASCLGAAIRGESDEALYWLPVWEDWTRRLEVGAFLRRGEVRPYQRMQGYILRKKLESLEHELEHDPFEQEVVSVIVDDLFTASTRWADCMRIQTDQ